MAKEPTDKFQEWFGRYGLQYEGSWDAGRITLYFSELERIAYRAYRKGRKDAQEKATNTGRRK